MANAFDLTSYQKIDLAQAVEGETTVEDALGALSTKKASKVSSATNGNFAGLDASGNLTDSGKKPSDFQTALTFDNAPTENSNNPVKSGGVYSALRTINQTLTNQVKDMNNVYGSKNVLASLTPSGTYLGLTLTRNEDNDIVVNGTSTGNPTTISLFDRTFQEVSSATILKLKDLGIDNTKQYVFSRAEKVSNLRYNIRIMNGTTQVAEIELGNSNGLYIVIDFSQYTCDGLKADIVVTNGTTITNKVFSAMLCLKELYDFDPTYVPYAKTNRQLTQDTTGLLDNTEVNGAVNMLPNNATSQVVNGITFTVNDDGTIICNGTATGESSIIISTKLKKGTYRFSGVPKTGSFTSYWSYYQKDGVTQANDFGDGVVFHLDSEATINCVFRIKIGYTASNLIFKPMITVASYNGDYVPYAKSNKELTEVNEYEVDTTSISGVIIMKRNNVVTVKVNSSFNIVHNQNYVVGQLPERFRPPLNVVSPIVTNEGTPKLTVLAINSTGQIEINGYMIATSGTYPFDGTMTFVTNK
jgi:hypothetical protein